MELPSSYTKQFIFVALLVTSFSSVAISTASSNQSVAGERPNHRETVDSGLLALYDMTNFYLEDMVQPRYLTWLQDHKGVDLSDRDAVLDSLEHDYWDWVEYWWGYSTCAVVGVVAILITSIVGISVACCRCCGFCGGTTDPKETRYSNCKRIGCGVSMIAITCFMFAGAVLMFYLNDVLKDRMQGDKTVFDDLQDSFQDVDDYLHNSVNQLNRTVLDGYIIVKEDVFYSLDHIPENSLKALDNATGVITAFNELDEFVSVGLVDLDLSLSAANELINNLTSITAELEDELIVLKKDIVANIGSCNTKACNDTLEKVENLALDANFTKITVTESLAAVQAALADDTLADQVQEVEDQLLEIAGEINTTVWPYTEETKHYMDELQVEIENFLGEVDNTVNSIDIDAAISALGDAKEAVDYPWDIVYWSVIALGTLVLVVVLCNIVGVIVGSFCPQPDPQTTCGYGRSAGADWLLAGVGVTFIFYWLFMLIVMILFLAGGLVHTEVCRNMVEYEKPESREVLSYFDHWINDTVYEETDGDVSVMVFDLYVDCQQNLSFYTALQLEDKGYDLYEILDLTEIERAVNEIKIAARNIDIGTVNLYPLELQTLLEMLGTTFANELNFTAFYNELSKNITTEDLLELADDLVTLADNETTVENAEGLKANAENLTSLHSTYVVPAEKMALELEAHLLDAEKILVDILNAEINKTLTEANATINANGNEFLQSFVNKTADDVYGDIEKFVHDVDYAVRNVIGACWPLYSSLTAAIDTSCVTTLWPVNGFWYSFGMVIFFLIPSVIIAFTLVTEYRKSIEYRELEDSFGEFAYKGAPFNENDSDMMLETAGIPQESMTGVDNPIFVPEGFAIPRPVVYGAVSNGGAGYPATSYPNKDPLPPSYDELTDKISISTHM